MKTKKEIKNKEIVKQSSIKLFFKQSNISPPLPLPLPSSSSSNKETLIDITKEEEIKEVIIENSSLKESTEIEIENQEVQQDQEEQEEQEDQDISVVNQEESNEIIIDYEKRRQENIRRNIDFLTQLGLAETTLSSKSSSLKSNDNDNREKSSKKRPLKRADSIPVKRIQPKRGVKNTELSSKVIENNDSYDKVDNVENLDDIDDSTNENDPLLFDDSIVFKYVMNNSQNNSTSHNELTNLNNISTTNSQLIPIFHNSSSINDENLQAIYSLHFHPKIPSLLVAAGKGGYTTIYSIQSSSSLSTATTSLTTSTTKERTSPEESLMSFKAHSRWISSAKFLSSQFNLNNSSISSSLHLLTAADDGIIKLWDISQCNQKSIPKEISSSNCSHEKGIFAMDERNGYILTGSKDKSISISTILTTGNIKVQHTYEDIHDGVVKSVSWKSEMNENESSTIFASGSQDYSVSIYDTRSSIEITKIQSVHHGGVHTVGWNPYLNNGGEFLLMTSGYDSKVHIYDLRRISSSKNTETLPLYTFQPDKFYRNERRASIITPHFLNSKTLIIPNEFSSSLTIHCLETGKTLSRGILPEQPLSVCCSTLSLNNKYPSYVVAACKKKGFIIPLYLTESNESQVVV